MLTPIEIKSAATFTPDFLKGIERFRSSVVRGSAEGFVLYDGVERLTVKGTKVLNPITHGEVENFFRL